MIKYLIFDADKVVINNEYIYIHLERDYGINQEKTRPFFDGIFLDCVVGKKDLKDIISFYLKTWGWPKTTQEFIDYRNKVENIPNKKLIKYITALRKKGIICCLATNQEKYRFEYMLNKMKFANLFDKLYTSAYMKVRKPNIQFYKKIIEDLKIKNLKEVLFWDDSEKNVETAKKIGINAQIYISFDDFKRKMNNYGIFHYNF